MPDDECLKHISYDFDCYPVYSLYYHCKFFLPILSILIQAKRVAIFTLRFRASKTSSFLFEGKMVLYSKSVI